MKVLLVEHPHVAGFLVEGLRDAGHIVDVASGDDAALTLGLSGDYDVILLALVVPKKGGIEVAAELRRAGQSTPILLLTPDEHDAERFVREAGADGYLAKPFRFEMLVERLRAVTRGR